MAKSKRPQAASGQQISYGVSESGPTVEATTNSETMIQPGLVGAPSPPANLAQPQLESNQEAVDREKLAVIGFDELSDSIRAKGIAEARGINLMQDPEFLAEQAALWADMRDSGVSFAEAVHDGLVDAIQHPRVAPEFARALQEHDLADRAAAWDAQHEAFKLGDPRALDIDRTMEAFHSSMVGETPAIARVDAYENHFIPALDIHARRFKAKHQDWLSERMITEITTSAQSRITDVVQNYTESEPITVVDLTPTNPTSVGKFGPRGVGGLPALPTRFRQETPEEFEARRLKTAVDAISRSIDMAIGGPITPENLNKITGKQLVDLAAEDPRLSKTAELILNKAVTGPADNRAPLLGGAIKEYYSQKQKSISAAQGAHSTATANRIWTSQADAIETSVIEATVVNAIDEGRRVGESEYHLMFRDMLEGRSSVTLPNGDVLSIDGDKYRLSPGPDSVATTDKIYDPKQMAKQARIQSFDQLLIVNRNIAADDPSYANHTDSEREAVARAMTASQLNEVDSPTSESIQRTTRSISIHRADIEAQRVVAGEETPETLAAFQDHLVYLEAVRQFNPKLFDDHFNNEDTKFFWETALAMRYDQIMEEYGGGSGKSVYNRLVGYEGGFFQSATDFETEWRETGVPVLTTHMRNNSYSDQVRAQKRIRSVARMLLALGVKSDSESAILLAVNSYEETLMDMGGIKVDKSEISPDLIAGNFPANWEQEWHTKDWNFMDLYGAHGIAEPEWLPDWFSSVQGEKAPLAWSTLTKTAIELPALLDGLWTYITEDNEEGMNMITNTMRDVAVAVQQGEIEGYKPMALQKVVDRAAQALETHPPDKWSLENMTQGGATINNIKLQVAPKSEGLLYTAVVELNNGISHEVGNPDNHGRPFTLSEISELSKRMETYIPDRTFPASLGTRAVEGVYGMDEIKFLNVLPLGGTAEQTHFRTDHGWVSADEAVRFVESREPMERQIGLIPPFMEEIYNKVDNTRRTQTEIDRLIEAQEAASAPTPIPTSQPTTQQSISHASNVAAAAKQVVTQPQPTPTTTPTAPTASPYATTAELLTSQGVDAEGVIELWKSVKPKSAGLGTFSDKRIKEIFRGAKAGWEMKDFYGNSRPDTIRAENEWKGLEPLLVVLRNDNATDAELTEAWLNYFESLEYKKN